MKLPAFSFLFSILISGKLLALDTKPANISIVLDVYNQSNVQTESKSSLGTKKTKTTELRSTKPGAMTLTVSWEKWAALANIAPDPATSGIVAVAYSVWDGHYLGGAYNLNESKTEGTSNHTRQNFFGLAGYNVLRLDEGNRATAFWTLGPSSSRGTADPGTGTMQAYKGLGTTASLSLRWVHVLAENFWYNPAIKFNRQTVEQKFSNLNLDKTTIRIELVPLGFCFKI